jgi:hypothetical protein
VDALSRCVPEDGQGAPKTRSNINKLIGFLDAFKAVPLV